MRAVSARARRRQRLAFVGVGILDPHAAPRRLARVADRLQERRDAIRARFASGLRQSEGTLADEHAAREYGGRASTGRDATRAVAAARRRNDEGLALRVGDVERLRRYAPRRGASPRQLRARSRRGNTQRSARALRSFTRARGLPLHEQRRNGGFGLVPRTRAWRTRRGIGWSGLRA